MLGPARGLLSLGGGPACRIGKHEAPAGRGYLGVRYKAPAASGGGNGNKAPSSEQEPSGDEAPAYTRLLKLTSPNMRGEDVRGVQGLLVKAGAKITADGIFGPKSREAVVAFQRKKGLSPDGVVGKATVTALGGAWKG